jgi:hypothetical protein
MDTRILRSRLWVVVDYNEACEVPADGRESPTAGTLVDLYNALCFFDIMTIDYISMLHCVIVSQFSSKLKISTLFSLGVGIPTCLTPLPHNFCSMTTVVIIQTRSHFEMPRWPAIYRQLNGPTPEPEG